MNMCNFCDRTYQHLKGLYKHLREKHNIYRDKYECDNCGEKFVNKSILIKHIQSFHMSSNKKYNGQRLKCSIIPCNNKFRTYKALREHLQNYHSNAKATQKDTYEFENMQEFRKWKRHIEDRDNVTMVKDCGVKRLKQSKERSYFICHRLLAPRCIDNNRKRSLKNCGSNKTGRACPAMIILTVGRKIEVIYYSFHIGHFCNLGRRFLNKQDRAEIAGKLSEGVSMHRILDDVRTAGSSSAVTEDGIKIIHLIERRGLHNIKRDFSIAYSTKFHDNDAISVKLWVESMAGSHKNAVLYYKEQGYPAVGFNDNDFVLIIMNEFQKEQLLTYGQNKICIDGTHGLNSYKFQLFTIVVVDNFGAGVPVSFCFSNRADTGFFSFYFQCIKDRVGTITTKVFMSDDAPSFYNAWLCIMGPAITHYYVPGIFKEIGFKTLLK